MISDVTRRTALGLMASAAVLPACQTSAAAPNPESWVPTAGRVDEIEATVSEFALPGMGIAVIEEGALAWQGSFGVTNIETGQKVQDDTLFQAASMTKPVFSWLVMKYIEEGRLSLDSRLVDYFRPEDFPDAPAFDAIRVRHVLTHATGMPNWRNEDTPEDVAGLVPAAEPGSGWYYSGEAFYWLQQVIETIEGKGLGTIARERLFEPAGLKDCFMNWSPETDGREVYGHEVSEDGKPVLAEVQYFRTLGPGLQQVADRWGRPIESWTASDYRQAVALMPPIEAGPIADYPVWKRKLPGSAMINAASSLRTTPADYARFLSLFFPHRPAGWELSAATRDLMMTPQVERPQSSPFKPWGLGIGIERRDDANLIYHEGNNSGRYISMALAQPERRRAIAVFTHGSRGEGATHKVMRLLTQSPFHILD